jgi:hypothetical protein
MSQTLPISIEAGGLASATDLAEPAFYAVGWSVGLLDHYHRPALEDRHTTWVLMPQKGAPHRQYVRVSSIPFN